MNCSNTASNPPTKMVVFDYSGTLSLDAALFGKTDHLIQELKRSGLWQLGLNSLEIFWREILNPTWQEGSTSAKSYKQLMMERVAQFLDAQDDKISENTIKSCVSKFVDGYLDHSQIAPEWKPLLSQFLASSDIIVVVATDHYLEVTEHIFNQLKGLGIDSISALKVKGVLHDHHKVFIANSADFGCRKSNREFWKKLKETLQIQTLSHLVLLDDFVSNERKGDRYVDQKEITTRMNNIIELLSTVFVARIEVFPFILRHNSASKQDAYRELINTASQFVTKILAEAPD